MPIAFSELMLHSDAQQENNTLFRLVPTADGHPHDFVRMRSNGEIYEGCDSYGTEVIAQFMHKYNIGIRDRIIGTPSNVRSYETNKEMMYGIQDEKLRDAYMVWSKQNGLRFREKDIDSMFPQRKGSLQLSDAWLVWGAQKNTESINRGDLLKKEMQKIGDVVYDINSHTASRVCICIQWCHGGQDNADYVKSEEFTQAWIAHQNDVVRAMHLTARFAGYSDLHFFPEGDRTENTKEDSDRRYNPNASPVITEELGEIYESRPDLALQYCQAIINKGYGGEFRDSISADSRFVISAMQKGLDPHSQVHGLSTKAKTEKLKTIDQKRKGLEDEIDRRNKSGYPFAALAVFDDIDAIHLEHHLANFQHTHSTAVQSLRKNLPDGKIGMMLLGSAHSRYHEKYDGLLEELGLGSPSNNHYIENYVEANPLLRNTRFMTVKPNSLAPIDALNKKRYLTMQERKRKLSARQPKKINYRELSEKMRKNEKG